MLALTLLVAFVAVRSASLHAVDSLIQRDMWSGVHLGSLLELAGIGAIAAMSVAVDLAPMRRVRRERVTHVKS